MATDQEMLERIAKLSSAIEQQKQLSSRGRGRGYAPSSRGRGMPYTAYRGRGYSRPPPATYFPARPIHNKYINPAIAPKTPPPALRPSSRAVAAATGSSLFRPPPISQNHTLMLNTGNTVPLAQTSHNKKLIINHKGNKPATSNTIVKSIDTSTGRKMVTIDGTDFVVKGKKLIRKDLFDSNTTKTNLMMANSTAPKVLVRKSIKSSKVRDKNKNMVIGKAPVIKRRKPINRQKGNMVFIREPEGYVRQGRTGKSLVLNTRKPALKKPRYCGFYTRYGKCPSGPRCPFVHDPSRRAICPRFLQNRCKKTADTCRLSHTPSPHIMPHCLHFQKGHCTNDACKYVHVKVSSDAPVCKAFAMEGYCPKGLRCEEKHVHVCPEFAETGKCSNANCRLPHVARRTAASNDGDDSKKQQAGIVRLGSWISPQYFYAQKAAMAEKKKAIEEATAAKVWTRPELVREAKEQAREKEEQEGFVRLFDDSDEDEGWSQYEKSSDVGDEDIKSLRFKDDEDDNDEEEEDDNDESHAGDVADEHMEEEEEETSDNEDFHDAVEADSSSDNSDVEEVYEEVSDADMSDA